MKRTQKWKGDEVEPQPAGRAEELADRAEGHSRTSADEEPPRPPRPAPGADDEENLREKTAEVKEEHEERERTQDPPRKNRL
jgi:hypothetical protein